MTDTIESKKIKKMRLERGNRKKIRLKALSKE
jgi:hypothetical protein